MSNQIPMTANQFLAVRNRVASQLNTAGSRQQQQTRVAIAEHLMAGEVDFVEEARA